MLSAIGLPVFSHQQLFQLTQDLKGLFKACNGAERKGMFHPKKAKSQGVFKRGSHTHKVGHERGICQIGSHSLKLPKIISRDSLT
ncbi:hypothetical protein H5410_014989 [Solanum commersonii]|uniref:Uncharacterized protein n=1 Tax=Solanum commersonii TaxID=4109 RepID=A0A9J5ZSC2_SOLCO|nr:hypothetical protein H5410_014989 [Solanum commersonii]